MAAAKAIAGIAAMTRAARSELWLRRLAATEPPPALAVLGQRRLEGLAGEVGPQLVAEDELGVRGLPQQVVRQPPLAAGADDEVGIVHLRCVEQPGEVVLVAAAEPRGRVDDLRAPAVVEGDEQRDALVARGGALGPVHLLHELGRDARAAADEAHPHALVVQLGRLAVDALAEHRHQTADLFRRARPVLGRERVDGQLVDAQVDGVAQPRLDDVGAGAVPLEHGKPARLRPATVAIGDDGDVPRLGRGHQTSRISASLLLRCDSRSAIFASVSFCSSASARRSSSSPASPPSRSSRRSCMTSRRTLRILTRPSSAMWRTTLTISRRRSSVSAGIASRIMLPSLDGLRPRSESRIDFSMFLIEDLSKGWTVSICASGAWMVASCLSGVGVP